MFLVTNENMGLCLYIRGGTYFIVVLWYFLTVIGFRLIPNPFGLFITFSRERERERERNVKNLKGHFEIF